MVRLSILAWGASFVVACASDCTKGDCQSKTEEEEDSTLLSLRASVKQHDTSLQKQGSCNGRCYINGNPFSCVQAVQQYASAEGPISPKSCADALSRVRQECEGCRKCPFPVACEGFRSRFWYGSKFGEIPESALPGERDGEAYNPVPKGNNLGRILLNTTLNPNLTCEEPLIPVGQCPPPNGFSTPPDGSGLGPMVFEKSVAGLPGPGSFVGCKSCPSCPRKMTLLYDAINQFKNYPQKPACQTSGTSAAFPGFQSEALVWSILGYGATNHACFGHTFVNSTELNNPCYSFGARIQAGVPYFRPAVEDMVMDSCGLKVHVRLFCPDCSPRQLCPDCQPPLSEDYPQRYTWILQLRDDDSLENGFEIVKLNAVLDTELTMDASVQDYDYDPYVCPVIRPAWTYPPAPEPRVNRLDLPVETFGNCSYCAVCPQRMVEIKSMLNAFWAGNQRPFRDRLACDVEFIVAGAGPTLGGCSTAIYHQKDGYWSRPAGFWARLESMTKNGYRLLASDISLGSCGDRANAWFTLTFEGKSNFVYTMTFAWTMYFEESWWGGWKISKILQNYDTEVMMNMAVREREYDSAPCRHTGPGSYAEDISHTGLQP